MAYDEGLTELQLENYHSALEAAKAIEVCLTKNWRQIAWVSICYCENGRATKPEELFKRALEMDEVILGRSTLRFSRRF